MDYIEHNTTFENLNQYLDQHGVAVIPNVLTDAECQQYRNSIWTELNYITQGKFDINNQSTWHEFYKLYPLHSMLLQHYSMGHMQPLWDIRQHPNVTRAFETIWNTPKEDLLVSFDGLSIHLPPEKTRRGWYLNNNWFHTDQSYKKTKKCCIQGLVNLYPVNQGDATLAVLKRSHSYHSYFNEKMKPDCEYNDDWYKLNPDEVNFYIDRGCLPQAIKADIGSLVLWDSRTIHQGKEAEKLRSRENFRMVAYVCMLPRAMSNEKALLKKQKAFNELRTTNHWANNPKLFPKTPRTYGGPVLDILPIHPPQLSDIGRRLAGFG